MNNTWLTTIDPAVYLLTALWALIILFVWNRTRTSRTPPTTGTSKYVPSERVKRAQSASRLAGNAPRTPTHDSNGHRYIKYFPPGYANRHARRALAKRALAKPSRGATIQ